MYDTPVRTGLKDSVDKLRRFLLTKRYRAIREQLDLHRPLPFTSEYHIKKDVVFPGPAAIIIRNEQKDLDTPPVHGRNLRWPAVGHTFFSIQWLTLVESIYAV